MLHIENHKCFELTEEFSVHLLVEEENVNDLFHLIIIIRVECEGSVNTEEKKKVQSFLSPDAIYLSKYIS